MRYHWTLLAIFVAVTPAFAESPKHNTLTPQEIADGWILLFDGETTFGWTIDGEAKVEEGIIRLGETKQSTIMTTSKFADFRLRFEYLRSGPDALHLVWGHAKFGLAGTPGWKEVEYTVETKDNRTVTQMVGIKPPTIKAPKAQFSPLGVIDLGFQSPERNQIQLRNIKIKPLNLQSMFSGKDLAGWKPFTTDEKRAKSKFSVTQEGWLNVSNGPGDLQTEKQFSDFIFQGECVSNGKHLNSGIFFRCVPGQYQQGYEMQIRNQWEGDDRAKPVDFGTGAIYRRQPARKVVSTDGEWYGMTLIAHGRHISTWINGYPVVDWTDPRPENENARNGCKLGAGPLSIQGHDPTTDLSFRNLRIAELK
jgi:hypothetical protein